MVTLGVLNEIKLWGDIEQTRFCLQNVEISYRKICKFSSLSYSKKLADFHYNEALS